MHTLRLPPVDDAAGLEAYLEQVLVDDLGCCRNLLTTVAGVECVKCPKPAPADARDAAAAAAAAAAASAHVKQPLKRKGWPSTSVTQLGLGPPRGPWTPEEAVNLRFSTWSWTPEGGRGPLRGGRGPLEGGGRGPLEGGAVDPLRGAVDPWGAVDPS